MGRVRFASFTWLLLIPIFATAKIVWELHIAHPETNSVKPLPIIWLDTNYSFSIFIGIGCILLATYLVFAYINAFINSQTTYAIVLFFGILMLLSFIPNLTSSLLATLLFAVGVLRLFSFDKKQKISFVVFDTGFFIGLSFIFDVHFILLAILLSFFLVFFRFSFREFLQYWAGISIAPLCLFPVLYLLNLLPSWQEYFLQLPQSLITYSHLNIIDYLLIGILSLFCTIQGIALYLKMKKPTEHLLLSFLLVYFLFSLLIGIVAYPLAGSYLIFIIPPITILYSLSKHENQLIPTLLVFAIGTYWLINVL